MKSKTVLLILILFITNNCFAQQSNSMAPEATVSEVEATADGSEVPFWEIPILENAFIDTTPADIKDGISVGELGIDGGDKMMILNLAQEIIGKKHGDFDSMLIYYQGKLLFESYYLRGRVNLPHPQASGAKAYTSLLLGRAIQLGFLTMADLDKPLVSFLKDLDPTKFVEGAEKITLHKALTMRAGLGISEEQREKFEKNPSQLRGQGQVQTLLEQSAPITEESQNFLYGNFNPNLVMQVIDAVVPGNSQEFIKNEFLDKMGITTYGWGTDVSGLPESGWRVSLTSRAMVKFGALIMNKGKWNDEQFIPEAFIAKTTNRVVRVRDDQAFFVGDNISDPAYGYFWWQANMETGGKTYFTTSAQGGGGQYIIVIEELDLIVVVTAHASEENTMQMTAHRILPAFMKE